MKKLQIESLEPAIQEVKGAMKATKDKRMFERYQTILLHLKGLRYEQIATIVGRSISAIGHYVREYKANGLLGLALDHSPGRPSRLSKEQEQQLYSLIVDKKPVDVGFPAEMNWTSFLLRDWIKCEFEIHYTDRGVREMLYRLNFSFTKPTYTLAKADPEKQEAFKKEFEEIKKTSGKCD